MDKETKILIALAYVVGVYLILNNKKKSQNQILNSNSNTKNPNLAPAPILPSNPLGLETVVPTNKIENLPIPLPSINANPDYKYQVYQMTPAELLECAKDNSKCKM